MVLSIFLFFIAIIMNKFTVANELINANASLNLRDNFGKTALFYGDFIY
jgi:hypothetical protein